MNSIANKMALLVVLLLASFPTGMAQSRTENSNLNSVEYMAGQLWTTGQGITVTVLAIEDVHRVGKVVLVRIDKIPYQSCGDIHLTRAIEHIALTEKMMQKSELVLSKDNIDLPESSIDAYRKWEEQKKHQILKVPIQKAILTDGDAMGPMICNYLQFCSKPDVSSHCCQKMRRERRWTPVGIPARELVSLHPMAIEVGCFSVTKSAVL
jgi:hypothetical protein